MIKREEVEALLAACERDRIAPHPDNEVLAELALPVAGLMSLNPFETVHQDLIALRAAARSLGVVLEEPFLQLAFLCLPVILEGCEPSDSSRRFIHSRTRWWTAARSETSS